MVFGFRLNLRCTVPIQSPHSFITSTIRLSSSSSGGRDSCFNPPKLSLLSTICEEVETSQNDSWRAHACSSSAMETVDNDCLEFEEMKINKEKRMRNGVHRMIDNSQMHFGEETSINSTNFQSFRASHFRLLMENVGILEETFADSETPRLEKDIILQLGKLGALELFNTCLSRSVETSRVVNFPGGHPKDDGEKHTNNKVDNPLCKVVVHSGRKREIKSRRKQALSAAELSSQLLPSKAIQETSLYFPASFVKRASDAKNKRTTVAKKEAEMSKGVKMLKELERVRAAMEEDTKQVASLSAWAEVSGVDEKVLQQRLHYGWYCRDELVRSTRFLVLYLARKYRGLGIAFEDLLQAGYVGVLQGAEKFDCTRGYKFSTYVHYWIRKSMSRMVARYARGILIPWSLSRAMNQIHKARKSMKSTTMRCPDDYEILKMTGLSLDKIRAASNCLRVVGSIDQKIGDCQSVKYMELMPDTAVESPEETVMKQHMIKDVHDLLKGLDPREKKVLTLRFGLDNNHSRSLEDIGRIFKISKERVRQIEKKALTMLRNEANNLNLSQYLDV